MSTQEATQNTFLGRALTCLSKQANHLAERLHKDELPEVQTSNQPHHSKNVSADLSGPTLGGDPEPTLLTNEEARVNAWMEEIPIVLIDPNTTHQLQEFKTPRRKVDAASQTSPKISSDRDEGQFYWEESPSQVYSRNFVVSYPPQIPDNTSDSPPALRVKKIRKHAPCPIIHENCVENIKESNLTPAEAPRASRPSSISIPDRCYDRAEESGWQIKVDKVIPASNRNKKALEALRPAHKNKQHADKIREPDFTHLQAPPLWKPFSTATIGRKQGLAFLAMSNEEVIIPGEEHDEETINEVVRSLEKQKQGSRSESRKTLESDSDEFMSKLRTLELEQARKLDTFDEEVSPPSDQEQADGVDASVLHREDVDEDARIGQTEEEKREAYFQERAEEYADRYAKCKPLNYESVKRDFDYVKADIKRVCKMAGDIHDAWKKREREKEAQRLRQTIE